MAHTTTIKVRGKAPARRNMVAAEMTLNFKAYRAKTTPNKKREAARKACRGRQVD